MDVENIETSPVEDTAETGENLDNPNSAAGEELDQSNSSTATQELPAMVDQQSDNTRPDRPGLRILVTLVMISVLGILAYLAFQRLTQARGGTSAEKDPAAALAQAVADPRDIPVEVASVPYNIPETIAYTGIQRKPEFKTTIPERSRVDVITYTVQQGDTLFEIADKYSIKPETLLWGNFETLKDNPHFLKEGQVLNILPVNGTYYEWHDGDTLAGVAGLFKVDPQDIIDFSGNPFDLTTMNTQSFGLAPGAWLVVPGGTRPIKDWGPPTITRSNPAAARYYGEGSCGSVYEGAIGNSTFIWPTVGRDISGYGYSGIHPGVDIGGALGAPIFSVDNGVVVFAGWSDYGYGYMVVIDHGNGYQTAYAHLSAVSVGCGQSVFQGGTIGALGSTGNSSGPHLHFELSFNGAKPNPLDYIR
jgi:murein DD-endopeptidase MepM/ murein hydrolase activator NlpD